MDLTDEEIKLLNWTLETVTQTKRASDQAVMPEDIEIVRSGQYGDKTTFGLPPKITDILDKIEP